MRNQPLGKLLIKSSDGAERTVIINSGQSLKIGRESDCDIVVAEPGVSRHHSTISASNNGVVVSDNGSTNGTFVNGDKLTTLHDIQTSDIIDIGGTKITLKLESSNSIGALSNQTSSRAMTAQLTPLSVTVLVTSVPNFSEMQKNLPRVDLDKMLNAWIASVKKIVESFNGQVDKVLGHRIVVVWKSKEAKLYALQAVKCAIKLRALGNNQTIKSAWEYEDAYPWTNTVVLGSGMGLQGMLGSNEGGSNFTVLGDPVNLAFKLEELVGKLGQDLIIEESTAELIKGEFKLEKVIKVKIKGSDQQLDIFTISK